MNSVAKNEKNPPAPALPGEPFPKEEMFARAVDCLNTGRLEEAAEFFERIIKADPEKSEAHYNLGLVRYGQESFAEAESCFRQAVRSNPANAEAHYHLGRLLGQTNRPAEAAACYLEVLEIHPEDVEAHYNLGRVLKDLDLLDEAIGCFEQVLKIDPHHGPAYGNLGVVLHIQGREEEAIAAYRQAGRLNSDSPSNRHILNALTGTPTDHPPEHYVTNLFDGYARRFDESLVAMAYEVPMLLRRALDDLPGPAQFVRTVDLGCGTGFSGLPFREKTRHLTGVDLSSKMLAVARGKKIYDLLCQNDLVSFLGQEAGFYDLFLLTDVCIYLGRLDPAFAAIRQRSRPGSLVLFSIELNDGADLALRSSGRYAHSWSYVERLATENCMVIEHRQATGIRKERGKWIDGAIFILQRI